VNSQPLATSQSFFQQRAGIQEFGLGANHVVDDKHGKRESNKKEKKSTNPSHIVLKEKRSMLQLGERVGFSSACDNDI
jgi:hypothetical protein